MIAWRIMLLPLMGRTAPGLPADLVFDAGEGKVLQLLTSKKLSVGEAMMRSPTRWLSVPRRGWPARFRVFVERIRHPAQRGKNYAAPSRLRIKPRRPIRRSKSVGRPQSYPTLKIPAPVILLHFGLADFNRRLFDSASPAINVLIKQYSEVTVRPAKSVFFN